MDKIVVITGASTGIALHRFGRNAIGGGADNRRIPGAQSAEDAVRAIVGVIERPMPEVYTQSTIEATLARYQREPQVVEAEVARAALGRT